MGFDGDVDHLRREVLSLAMDKAGIKRLPRAHGIPPFQAHSGQHCAQANEKCETGSDSAGERSGGHDSKHLYRH